MAELRAFGNGLMLAIRHVTPSITDAADGRHECQQQLNPELRQRCGGSSLGLRIRAILIMILMSPQCEAVGESIWNW